MIGPRTPPPELPGFAYQRFLGGGGFADVFLYDQSRPARPVAIKVLRTPVGTGEAAGSFDDEANLMARVSAHPYIVTIYDAAVTSDGRAYLVMEYYPGRHFGERAKGGHLSVPEVLHTGIQIAGAVETAHRAGILHRDIKPANILTSQYNQPGLTDFGISSAREGGGAQAPGLSVAYAAKEVLEEANPGDVSSDVYSLTATLYTLLAGRSPFEVPGGSNSTPKLVDRIFHAEPAPIQRDDMPPSLEHLLAQGLSKDPAQRPRTAAELFGSLQSIQRELHLAVTEPQVLAEELGVSIHEAPDERGDSEDRTRYRNPLVVRPHEPAGGDTARRPPRQPATSPAIAPPVTPLEVETAGKDPSHADLPIPTPAPPDDTYRRPPTLSQEPSGEAAGDNSRGRRNTLRLGAAAFVVVVALVAGYLLFNPPRGQTPGPTLTPSPTDTGALVDSPQIPQNVVVMPADGGLDVTWSVVAQPAGSTYGVRRVDGAYANSHDPPQTANGPPVHIAVTGTVHGVCVGVYAQRGPHQSDDSRSCVP